MSTDYKAVYITKNGPSEKAFKIKSMGEVADPELDEVGVEIEAFGLNFADVMARLGLYRDAPPLPSIIGYESVGKVVKKGQDAGDHVQVGDRVIAFTRFGSYAQYTNTKALGVVPIGDYDTGKALALATQYCTAYYGSNVATNVMPGEKVLIQAAAGGVGTALIQLCKLKGCYIYGTAGSEKKLDYLRSLGVDQPINYRENNFWDVIKEPVDIVFDSIGGKHFRKGLSLLNKGGRMVAYGAASQTDSSNIFGQVKFGLDFGIYHPAQFLMNCQSLIGINMLRIADHRPDIMKHCLGAVVELAHQGKIDPTVGGMYSIDQLNEAHDALEKRKTIGKIGVYW